MEVEVLTEEEALTTALAVTSIPDFPDADFGVPTRIPGMAESWHQVLVDLGVLAIPAGIVGNAVASWLLTALNKTPSPTRAKIVLRHGENEAEFDIESVRAGEIKQIVEAAVKRVYRT